LTAFYFQVISKSVIYLQIAHVIFVIYLLVQTIVLFPESPRFDYSKERYALSKKSLTKVSKVNGNPNYNSHKFKFDVEKAAEDAAANPESKEALRDGGNEYGITNGEFTKNLILMSLLFTCFSFSFWLCDF